MIVKGFREHKEDEFVTYSAGNLHDDNQLQIQEVGIIFTFKVRHLQCLLVWGLSPSCFYVEKKIPNTLFYLCVLHKQQLLILEKKCCRD